MKICIVSLSTKELDYMDESISNKQHYCEKHNYTFVNYNERLSKRHCPWDKIQCLIKTIGLFDYAIWIDADAIFNDLSIKFENIINEHSNKDLLICKDPCYDANNHCMVNTGVMIFKNTANSIRLLNDTWNSCNDYCIDSLQKHSYDGYPHEQGALATLLRTSKYSNNYHLYEQTKFNAHPSCSNSKTFIIHYMGSRQSPRHINDFVNSVKQINCKNSIPACPPFYTPTKTHKIALTTMYTDNIKSYGEISTKNKEWYSSKYNIDLIVSKNRLSTRHPAWDKIQCVLNAMKKDYDYVIWMDADAIFLTDQVDFNTIINVFHEKNFIVCYDPNKPTNELRRDIDYNHLPNLHIINTGVFIIKNNDEMKQLLEKAWNTTTNTNRGISDLNKVVSLETCVHNWDDWPYEQGTLSVSFAGRNDIAILPETAFNTITRNANETTFVLHDMGGRTNETAIVKLFSEWNAKLNIGQEHSLRANNANITKRLIDTICSNVVMTATNLPHSDSVFLIDRNVPILLEIHVFDTNANYEIEFTWNLPSNKQLSHIFKVNEVEYNFGSEHQGSFFVAKPTTELSIYHTYEWFGHTNWELIQTLQII